MKRIMQCAAAMAAVCCFSTIAAGADEAERLHKLFDDAWQTAMREDPLWATATGDYRFNAELPDASLAAHVRRVAQDREFLLRLEQIDRDRLTAVDRTHYDVFRRQLRDGIEEAQFETYLMPITNRWGFHVALAELPKDLSFRTRKDFADYIARLEQAPRYTDQHIELMRLGIDKGLTLPAITMEGVFDSIVAHVVDDPTKSLFYEPFLSMPVAWPADVREALAERARQAIETSIVPAYRKFLTFMREEYVPACRGSIGASALPQGRDWYRYCVRHYTSLDLTPLEVHETGKAEVARIATEMDAVVKKAKFSGDRQAFVEHLRTDPRYYATSKEELLKEVALTLKRMDGELPRLFGR
ncbi:MAG: DUF885 domain-containing protein, partial [Planctomycetales bacterium]|nr:DUF885 domain-containing protein [Planctomycetales bacterium]